MIDRQKFEASVYSLLFPEGLIPLSCKPCLGLMDSRISEIHSLARGEGTTASRQRRILDPAESAALSRRIVELRDSKYPPIHYTDIARELGNVLSADACQCRYHDYKIRAKELPKKDEPIIEAAAPPALHEEKPEPVENPTDRNSRIVEKAKEVKPKESKRQHTPSQRGHLVGPKIPHSEDLFIFDEKESGKTFSEIRKTLVQRGFDCTVTDVSQRYYTDLKKRMAAVAKVEGSKTSENVAPVHPEVPDSPSPPGVEGAQELAREASGPTRGTPEEKPPAPKSISRAERDLKIWDLWKEGKSPEAISDLIYSEGFYYDARAVRRILLQQGASL